MGKGIHHEASVKSMEYSVWRRLMNNKAKEGVMV
jgi:hypothetical protein